MPLSKSDLSAIEQVVRRAIGEELSPFAKTVATSLAAAFVRFSEIEKKLDDGIAEFTSDLESLRDALSD